MIGSQARLVGLHEKQWAAEGGDALWWRLLWSRRLRGLMCSLRLWLLRLLRLLLRLWLSRRQLGLRMWLLVFLLLRACWRRCLRRLCVHVLGATLLLLLRVCASYVSRSVPRRIALVRRLVSDEERVEK